MPEQELTMTSNPPPLPPMHRQDEQEETAAARDAPPSWPVHDQHMPHVQNTTTPPENITSSNTDTTSTSARHQVCSQAQHFHPRHCHTTDNTRPGCSPISSIARPKGTSPQYTRTKSRPQQHLTHKVPETPFLLPRQHQRGNGRSQSKQHQHGQQAVRHSRRHTQLVGANH